MARVRKILAKAVGGDRGIRFGEFQSLLEAFGFRLDRVRGSHHIYVHPNVPRPLSIQPRRGEAKPYQIRQFLDMVEAFGLTLNGEA